MNSESPGEPEVVDPKSVDATQPSKRPVWIGFAVGVLCWSSVLIPQPNYGQLVPLLFCCFALPPIAIVVALIPKTRRFGLGLVLGTGAGWLVLGAICGASSLR